MMRTTAAALSFLFLTSLAIAANALAGSSAMIVINKSKSEVACSFQKYGVEVQGSFVVKKNATAKFTIPSGNLRWFCNARDSAMSVAFGGDPITMDNGGRRTVICTHWKNRYDQNDANCELKDR